LAHEIADELTNAFVIEKNRHASRADVNGHAIPDYQGIWVIYLEVVSVDQRHGKWPVRLSLLERFQNVIKVCRFHSFTFFAFREFKPNGIIPNDIIAVAPGPGTGRTTPRQ
jgi:hypothetical protein